MVFERKDSAHPQACGSLNVPLNRQFQRNPQADDTKEQYFIIYTSLELIKCNKNVCSLMIIVRKDFFLSFSLHSKGDYLSLARTTIESTRFNIIKITSPQLAYLRYENNRPQ